MTDTTPTNEVPLKIYLVLFGDPPQGYSIHAEEMTIWGDFEPGTLPMFFIPVVGDKYAIADHDITVVGRNQADGKVVLEAEIHFRYNGRDDTDIFSKFMLEKAQKFVDADFVCAWLD